MKPHISPNGNRKNPHIEMCPKIKNGVTMIILIFVAFGAFNNEHKNIGLQKQASLFIYFIGAYQNLSFNSTINSLFFPVYAILQKY